MTESNTEHPSVCFNASWRTVDPVTFQWAGPEATGLTENDFCAYSPQVWARSDRIKNSLSYDQDAGYWKHGEGYPQWVKAAVRPGYWCKDIDSPTPSWAWVYDDQTDWFALTAQHEHAHMEILPGSYTPENLFSVASAARQAGANISAVGYLLPTDHPDGVLMQVCGLLLNRDEARTTQEDFDQIVSQVEKDLSWPREDGSDEVLPNEADARFEFMIVTDSNVEKLNSLPKHDPTEPPAPVEFARYAYDRVLLCDPFTDPEFSEFPIHGLSFWVLFEQEYPAGLGQHVPAGGPNRELHVSYTRAGGLQFEQSGHPWPFIVDEYWVEVDLTGGGAVVDPHPISKDTFEAILSKHRDQFIEDQDLQSTAYAEIKEKQAP